MRNKILVAIAVGVLILVGSSVGSAVLIETGVVGTVADAVGFKKQAPAPFQAPVGSKSTDRIDEFFKEARERGQELQDQRRAWEDELELNRLKQDVCNLKRAQSDFHVCP